MVKIIGKLTVSKTNNVQTFTVPLDGTVATGSWNYSSTTRTLDNTVYICPADGNMFQLEKGDKKRKYCSNECRFKNRH